VDARSLEFIREAVRGEIRNGRPGTVVRDVCLDSRKVAAGNLFIALQGERFDGHDHLTQAFNSGAGAALVERAKVEGKIFSGPLVLVENSRIALGALAARYRRDFDLPRIAVAGSNGKTSTKNLIASVLQQHLPTLASEASFNNDIGVPVTLLNLEVQHGAAVFEVGTNHPGELRPLLRMIAPEYGVLTSIGPEHLEFFGDIRGVVEEEGVLGEELPPGGILFLNIETPEARSIINRTSATVRTIGFKADADWAISNASLTNEGTTFSVSGNRNLAGSYSTCLIGMHQALNATMAIAVGSELGLGRAEIQRGLSACKPAKMRLQIVPAGAITIFDDTYNANEESMKAALDTLSGYPVKGRRVAILGSMGELGAAAEVAHFQVGKYAAKMGVQHLIALGAHRATLAEGARQNDLKIIEQYETAEMLIPELAKSVQPGDVVLVKSSRLGKLECVVDALVSTFNR
jgi:UDP-N-acetylmuramoyl-tripeptide--D-alanyl-D-alanine ligase